MRPAPPSKSNPIPLIPSNRDEDILKAIYQYLYMAARDVCYLFYSPKSLTFVRERLAALCGREDHAPGQYLYRFQIPNSSIGNKERIFTLAAKGRALLESLGLPVDWHYQPAKVRNFSHSLIVHNILLTRVAVYAHYFCRTREDLTLEYRLCYSLSRDQAMLVPSSEGPAAKIAVVPDALFLFTQSTGQRQQILIELDRGFEAKQKFLEHVKARIDLIQSRSYTKVFGERSIRIAYLTTGNTLLAAETRRLSMIDWTMQMLKEMFPNNASSWASLFYFACIDPDKIYQSALFTAPLWYKPNSPTIPVPLLDNL